LAIALGVDAISDPLVGRWSDRHQSVLGRRHPFLYAAILPASLFFYLIWAPPFELTSQSHLFVYLLVMIIALRLSMTFFFVPMYAMVPELTTDYDERTALVNWRISSNYFIGGLMSIAMYGIWLADTPEYPDGILRADGYVEAGIVGGALILVGMLFAAAGTHREIPRLRKTPKKKTQSARGLFAEYWKRSPINPFWRSSSIQSSFRSRTGALRRSGFTSRATTGNSALSRSPGWSARSCSLRCSRLCSHRYSQIDEIRKLS
jgi:GPH family glycoside/pentoside/hexuronide:cation symporter